MTYQLKDVVNVLFKRKKLIFYIWSFCLFAAVIYSIFAKSIYESSASILIKVGRENIYVPPPRATGELAPIVDSDIESQINSEAEILKSRLLAEKVLNTLGPKTIYTPNDGIISKFFAQTSINENVKFTDKVNNKALQRLLKDLKVEGLKKTNVIKISFRHTDPEVSAKVLNTLLNLYLEEHLKIHQEALSVDFFSEQSKKLNDELQQAEIALDSFKKQNKISSPEEQKKLLLTKQSDLHAELIKTERAELEALTRVKYYKNRPAPNAAYKEVLESVLKSESELKEARVKKPLILRQIADYQQELNQLAKLENEFQNLQQHVELSRQNLRLYMTNLQEAHYRTALDKDKVSNVTVIDPAWPALEPVTPKKLFIIVALLLGAIASIGLALFLEYIDSYIKDAKDVEKCLPGLPLLATIPSKEVV